MFVSQRVRPFVFFIILLITLLLLSSTVSTARIVYSDSEPNFTECQIDHASLAFSCAKNRGDQGIGKDFSTDVLSKVEFIGQIGGESNAVAVKGDLAYLGEGPTITVLDISDPSALSVVGKTSPFPDIVQAMDLVNDTIYAAAGAGGLRIIDVTDSAKPIEIGYYDTPGDALGVAVSGNHAFVADRGGGLRIIDVSDPTAPTEIGVHDTDPSHAYDVAVSGNLAFVGAGWSGLRIIDFSDPAHPSETGFYSDMLGYSYNVAVEGSYAYVTDRGGRLHIIDVAIPSSPSWTGSYETHWRAHDLVVVDNYAYVADVDLYIINVADPYAPALTAKNDTPREARGVAVAGNSAYVAGGGLQIVNVADPTMPTKAGVYETPEAARRVAVAGNYAYITDSGSGLHVIDVTDAARPLETGFTEIEFSADDVAVDGDYAYVTENYGLRIINVSDPSTPTHTAFHETPAIGRNVAVAGNYAYVATGGSGLRIIDVGDPSKPAESGYYQTTGDAQGVAVAGNYAYFLDSGLHIIDVSDTAEPSAKDPYTSWYGLDVDVADNYVYVSTGDEIVWSGLYVIDIADPEYPTEAASLAFPATATAVAVAGNLAYVANRANIMDEPYFDSWLRIVNVADPGKPSEVVSYDTPGTGSALAADENYVYFADGSGGLLILRYVAYTHGRILIDKVTVPSGESQAFPYTFSGGPDALNEGFSLADTDDPWDSGELKPGQYRISETVPSGWVQSVASCDDGSDPTNIQLDASKTVTCTFINMKLTSPTAGFIASPDTGAPPLRVDFTNLSTGDYDQCLWDFGDGGTATTCEDPSRRYENEGYYTVTLAVKGPSGEDTKTVEQCINVAYYRIFLPGVLGTK